MTTAFVLSGGANLGAIQVGMLRALAERGIAPDSLVGTSVGALNAGYIAGHGMSTGTVDDLADVWRGLRTWQLFPPSPRQLFNVIRRRESTLFGSQGLRRLTERHLTFDRIENAPIPLSVVATDLLTGNEVDIRNGPAVDAILASAAIPAVLPPVRWHGRLLIDGGVADNTAISNAVQDRADVIYVLPCGYPCALADPPSSVPAMLLHTMELLIHKRLVRDIREYNDDAELIVLPPPCPINISPMDFSHADELITRGYVAADEFLAIDGGRRAIPSDYVDLHIH